MHRHVTRNAALEEFSQLCAELQRHYHVSERRVQACDLAPFRGHERELLSEFKESADQYRKLKARSDDMPDGPERDAMLDKEYALADWLLARVEVFTRRFEDAAH